MPTSTAFKKQLDEAYCYAKLASAAYSAQGDIADIRMTGATTAEVTNGSESATSGAATVYIIALTKVKAATVIKLNASESASAFTAGSPAGTCITKTLTATCAPPASGHSSGTAGERFLVLKDPSLTSADPLLLYIQSKSETQASEAERPVYDKGIFKGVKKIPVAEPNSLSLAQHFQAHDKGLLAFRGHRFNMLVERDDDRAGTITEQEYYFGCHFPNAGPNESAGDTDSDVSFEIQYLWKGVIYS